MLQGVLPKLGPDLYRLARVRSVERIDELAEACRRRLASLGVDANVEILVGDGTRGLPEHAPHDAIVVTAAGPAIPQPLFDQLAEGGRLVMPIGGRDEQRLVRVERRGEERVTTDLCGCRFVPLIGEHGFPG